MVQSGGKSHLLGDHPNNNVAFFCTEGAHHKTLKLSLTQAGESEWCEFVFLFVKKVVREYLKNLWIYRAGQCKTCRVTLPETNIFANGWLEYGGGFLLGFPPIFRCELL